MLYNVYIELKDSITLAIIKLSTWAKDNGYSYRGAYRLFNNNLIPNAFKNDVGSIMIDNTQPTTIKTVIYARVSSSKQKDDLDRQAERLSDFTIKNGWVIDTVVKEVASGLNDKRPKLQAILNTTDKIRLIVEHKDRLTRFGFNYIETLLNGEIVVVNRADSDKEDLMQDLISVITSMVARYYGNRKGSIKTKEIINKL